MRSKHPFKALRRLLPRPFRALLERIAHLIKREPDAPEDPYAYVTAPKKPRPPYRSAAAVAELPEE